MALSAGTKLGPYEILSAIGSGGMGEVYKARDTRLDRTVAIKVLPSVVAADPDAKQRFTREAKTISSLNHPNICTLHDVGSEDGTDFLVMEHLDGETLAKRLSQGPLPLALALAHAVAIADALYKAHRQGITHRDLKPGNVMLTASGAKLLDFGLAKLTRPASPFATGGALSAPPTATSPLTGQGMILGTLQYMSPEQLQGKEADARSDVFAFGALVYEMVTGLKAFQGEDQASIIGAILERQPAPVSDLQPLTPAGLDRVLKKCLAKDPDRRWQSAGDLTDALRWLSEPASGETAGTADSDFRPASPGGRLAWAAGLLLVGGIVGALAVRITGPTVTTESASTLTHATLSLRPDQQLVGALLNAPPLAISPDGTQVAYVVSEGTTLQLYVLRLDEFEPRRIPDSDGANSPFFSPDGQWIGFFARDGLYRASTIGGAPVRIADGPAVVAGAHWTPDDTIFYADLNRLYRIPASGGTSEVVLQAGDSGMAFVFGPHVLPGGDRLLAQVAQPDLLRLVVAVDVDTGEVSQIPGLEGASWATFQSPETLYYLRGSDLWSGRFDLDNLSLAASSTLVLEEVEFQSNSRMPLAAVSASGTLVYAARGPQNQLVWVDRQGTIEPLAVDPGRYRFPRLDPVGSRILVADNPREAIAELHVIDLERGGATRLSPGDFPVWSADGQSVTAAGAEGVGLTLTQISIASPSNLTHLMSEGNNVAGDWTEDGRLHVFYRIESDTNRDIWVVSSDGVAEPFVATPANERTPYFEPSGRWVVYVSDVSGRDEVYVQAYPEGEERWVISTEGGREPVWSADGAEIFYRSGGQMVVVDVTLAEGNTLEVSAPRVLFEGRFGFEPTGLVNYDVSKDGQRFLMLTDRSPTELRVIEDFGAMVEERLAETSQ